MSAPRIPRLPGDHRTGAARGERNKNAKLTAEKVRAARQRYLEGESISSLARFYGVAGTTMARVVNGESWVGVAP